MSKIKTWKVDHYGNSIRVENSVFSERLYVNDKLQDEQIGLAYRLRLWSQLETGGVIKISIEVYL